MCIYVYIVHVYTCACISRSVPVIHASVCVCVCWRNPVISFPAGELRNARLQESNLSLSPGITTPCRTDPPFYYFISPPFDGAEQVNYLIHIPKGHFIILFRFDLYTIYILFYFLFFSRAINLFKKGKKKKETLLDTCRLYFIYMIFIPIL